MFQCMECGKKFRSVKAAERAAWSGCPKCGSVDIDIYVKEKEEEEEIKLSPPRLA